MYIRSDGIVLAPGNWLRLPPEEDSPHGSIGKFWGCYSNPNHGRMFRLTYWRPLSPDGRSASRPDLLISKLDKTANKDFSDWLERAWVVRKPSRLLERPKQSTVIAFPGAAGTLGNS
jgi:hypothetical protein